MSLVNESLTGNYRPCGNEREASIILAFAFGRGRNNWGIANEAIGKFAIKKSKELQIPIVAQKSVAEFIEAYGVECERIDPSNDKQRRYMNTGHVLDTFKQKFDAEHIKVMIIAQAYHAPRANAEVSASGIETILPVGLPHEWGKDSIPIEAHCRNRLLWTIREPIVLLTNKILGKI